MEKRPRIPEILPHQIAPTARHLPDDVTVYLDPEEAAGTIQRVYRGYRTRRELQGLGVTASLRWFGELEGLRQAPRDDFKGPNSSSDDDCISPARKHWHRAVDVAMRASKDDDQLVKQNGSDLNEGHSIFSKASPKTMDLQYFLEMVDAKHRHGSNLRVYHTVWKSSPSSENFFYWLDYGGGKNVELPQCSREQLEKDQVRYLSPEERFHYLVEVDDAGLFRWAKNNELVETDNSRFQDSLHGVVPVVDDVSQYEDNVDSGSISSQSDSASHLSSSLLSPSSRNNEDGEFSTLTQEDDELNKATKRFCRIRPAAVYDHFAGSLSIKDGMWIFVSCAASLCLCVRG
ncbi:hypothetical protein N7462_011029 [Penicillium macrosclerotiorum]|uniref:uncharacterized protein n=1 Tax=Penicillium macrosclerotiorum TaxID=303699 RepID=UPI0025483A5E|nr:uncharacterized protein N7462_011029 [Penicillium macrosclerotiorum]KAJ5666620.1 hypothetical protein N7462_011029 [Penicillium macrosclerotiorum]